MSSHPESRKLLPNLYENMKTPMPTPMRAVDPGSFLFSYIVRAYLDSERKAVGFTTILFLQGQALHISIICLQR